MLKLCYFGINIQNFPIIPNSISGRYIESGRLTEQFWATNFWAINFWAITVQSILGDKCQGDELEYKIEQQFYIWAISQFNTICFKIEQQFLGDVR